MKKKPNLKKYYVVCEVEGGIMAKSLDHAAKSAVKQLKKENPDAKITVIAVDPVE